MPMLSLSYEIYIAYVKVDTIVTKNILFPTGHGGADLDTDIIPLDWKKI